MHLVESRGPNHPLPSEITPRAFYLNRRQWLAQAAVAGGGLAPWAAREAMAQGARPGKFAPLSAPRSTLPGAVTMERPTSYTDITNYNNFYEFGTDKSDPTRHAGSLKTRPWSVLVEGEVKKPGVYDIEALLKLAPMEERIYRLRCVEGWSMVVPWVGYSLAEPTGNAKFVQFTTLADRDQMPGIRSSVLDWPYVEGLRMDEAMHALTLLDKMAS